MLFSWWQDTKLAASGVDLGSAALFKVRLGFSGTPSDLLPKSLQPCMVEPGSDAQYMRVLTSNKFVQPSVVEAGWTVQSLLLWTVRHQPQFHALIDAGALITGMTNEEVARFLLDHGTMDACVYVLAVALALQQRRLVMWCRVLLLPDTWTLLTTRWCCYATLNTRCRWTNAECHFTGGSRSSTRPTPPAWTSHRPWWLVLQ